MTVAVTEDKRHELFEGLIDLLGRERTSTLMELLPPVGWADVATKRDLDQQTSLLRHELDQRTALLRQEIHDVVGELREETRYGLAAHVREFASLRTEMRDGFAAHDRQIIELRGEMHAGLAGLEASFEKALREQTRVYLFGMASVIIGLGGLTATFVQLFSG
jgi:hypothetical protein